MAPNERVAKAFSVMRSLGIPPKTVKPVLRKLLMLYDRNWQLIEEDNYRALADAIFEIQDDEKLSDKKAEMLQDEPEPSLKIPHVQDHEDQISSTIEDGSTLLPLEEEGENHQNLTPQMMESSLSIPRKRTMESDRNSRQALIIEKGKEPISSTMDPLETNSTSEGASCAFYSVPHFDVPSQYGSSNSINLLPQQPHIAFGNKRSIHVMSDITKGTEKVKIPLLDEIGNEHLPNFVYIAQNTVYQNAYVHVALARIANEDCCPSCVGDCLSSSVPCACARDTGGEFAYTPQGLLKEEFLRACIAMNTEPQKQHLVYCQDCPLERAKNLYNPEQCKGHLIRKFIKECWRKCGCSMQCGNRVVQRGITSSLQVFTTEGKGWGLRTMKDLPRGTFVCEYVGEILTNIELYDRNKQSRRNERHTYPVLLDSDWGSEQVLKDEDALCLDATQYGNVARFINHRCFDANLLEIPVEVENPDHHYYHVAFFTKRHVKAFEELTWDYGIDFDDDSHPVKAFQCSCSSTFCRDTKQKGYKSSKLSFKAPRVK